jgi:DNA repair protein RadC
MKIEVLDHIIVGKRTAAGANDYISLKEMGVLC